MSIQSEIDRISGNVRNTLSAIEQTGVTVPEDANSDQLPSLTAALANTKQDKLAGTKGQIVGFNSDGVAVAQDAPESGMTQDAADARYLKLTGGIMTGSLHLFNNLNGIDMSQASDPLTILGANGVVVNAGGNTMFAVEVGNSVILEVNPVTGLQLADVGMDANHLPVINLPAPQDDADAANKSYVDQTALTTVQTALNRNTNVSEADTNYTTFMARASSLNSASTAPTQNGQIAWTYE